MFLHLFLIGLKKYTIFTHNHDARIAEKFGENEKAEASQFFMYRYVCSQFTLSFGSSEFSFGFSEMKKQKYDWRITHIVHYVIHSEYFALVLYSISFLDSHILHSTLTVITGPSLQIPSLYSEFRNDSLILYVYTGGGEAVELVDDITTHPRVKYIIFIYVCIWRDGGGGEEAVELVDDMSWY